ncbi:unnamed protein product [Blepharisma stoltei]|uniref:F-box domain-containing protein n=1 Tax=Blepharisma stoltei TaxID=1481888 RepID=A0AAU9II97_9CILI|nr:unnamed protein product [Blepharisma stoltei]
MSKKVKGSARNHIKLEDLPQDILIMVLKDFLDISDWGRLACVCSWQWNIVNSCWSTLQYLNFYQIPLLRATDFKTVIKKCNRLKKLKIDCTYLDLSALAYIPTGLEELRLESLDRIIGDENFLLVLERLQFLKVLKLSVYNKSIDYKINRDRWFSFLSNTNIISFEFDNMILASFSELKKSQGLFNGLSSSGIKKLKIWNSKIFNLPCYLEKLKIIANKVAKTSSLSLTDNTIRIIEENCISINKLKIVDYNTRIYENDILTNEGISTIYRSWSKIKYLWLTSYSEVGVNFVDENTILQLLTSCENLRVLGLDGFKHFTDSCTQVLSNKSPNLERLSLSFTYITDASLFHISSLKQLCYLSLRNCKRLSESGLIELFQHMPALETLNLSGASNVTNQVMHALSSNSRNLKQLIISNAQITSLCNIASIQSLNDLSIINCHKIENSESFKLLAQLRSLTNLSIVGSKTLTHESFAAIMDCIGRNLRKLRLDGCKKLDDRSFLKIAQSGKKIRILLMKDIELTSQILSYLGLMWANLKHFTVSNFTKFESSNGIASNDHEFRIMVNVQEEILYFSSS